MTTRVSTAAGAAHVIVEVASVVTADDRCLLSGLAGADPFESPWPDVEPIRALTDPGRIISDARATGHDVRSAATEQDPVDGSEAARVATLVTRAPFAQEALGHALGPDTAASIDPDAATVLELVIAVGDPAVNLPWEYVKFADHRSQLALRPGSGVIRRVVDTCGSEPVALARSDVVLFDPPPMNPAARRDRSFDAVIDWFADNQPATAVLSDLASVPAAEIMYVVGHGGHATATRAATIAGMDADTLADHLDDVGWPRLIVLVACRTNESAFASESFAATLVTRGAAAVLGIGGDLETTRVAPALLDGLAAAINDGADYLHAVRAARRAIADASLVSQWGLPVLTLAEGVDVNEVVAPSRVSIERRAHGDDPVNLASVESNWQEWLGRPDDAARQLILVGSTGRVDAVSQASAGPVEQIIVVEGSVGTITQHQGPEFP